MLLKAVLELRGCGTSTQIRYEREGRAETDGQCVSRRPTPSWHFRMMIQSVTMTLPTPCKQ